jgi:hypothetical protein
MLDSDESAAIPGVPNELTTWSRRRWAGIPGWIILTLSLTSDDAQMLRRGEV